MTQPTTSTRELLVFAPTAEAPPLLAQRAISASSAAGFAERDLRMIEIIGDTNPLRRRHDVPADQFRVLLLGKDGGVKLRRDTPIDTVTLFATIDAMPMRRDEMQR